MNRYEWLEHQRLKRVMVEMHWYYICWLFCDILPVKIISTVIDLSAQQLQIDVSNVKIDLGNL